MSANGDNDSSRHAPNVGNADFGPHVLSVPLNVSPEQMYTIAEHVFERRAHALPRMDYAAEYQLVAELAGGDVVDVFAFDNGSVAFSAADVEGRGVRAATLAALIKFALRAYASAGMMPEMVVARLNRLYVEHCKFEKEESFASVFFGYVDAERRTMGYCSAGHDVALLTRPEEQPQWLPVTGPVIGILEDDRAFAQRHIELLPGSMLLLGTDGLIEARDSAKNFYGSDRLRSLLSELQKEPVRSIVQNILEDVVQFAGGRLMDDAAVLGVRFY